MNYRKANVKDLNTLTDFWHSEEKLHRLFDREAKLRKDARKRIYKHLKSRIGSKDYAAFIAYDRNKAGGVIQGYVEPGYFPYNISKIGHIGTVFVKEDYRNKGILSNLFKAMVKWFKSRNAGYSSLYVHPKNKAAMAAWSKLGYKEILKFMRRKL